MISKRFKIQSSSNYIPFQTNYKTNASIPPQLYIVQSLLKFNCVGDFQRLHQAVLWIISAKFPFQNETDKS